MKPVQESPAFAQNPEFPQYQILPAEKLQPVNSDALVIARELAGYSQSELAEKVGCSQAKISKFEDGITRPSSAELCMLSNALSVPVKFFHRADVRRSIFNSFYRKRKSIPQKAVMRFNAWVCFRQVQIDRLMSKVDIDTQPLPRFDMEDAPGGFEQIAQAMRQFLKIPPGPVKKLVSLLENAGVVVVLEDFDLPKLDGVSTFSNSGVPIIFLNKNSPPSRRRLTVAHEFSHTVLHRSLSPDIEDQANELASEFLMPSAEITSDLRAQPITLARLVDLKLKWKVSMAAILYRAKKLGVIEQRKYSYLFMQLGQAGYRVAEPHEDIIADDAPGLEREMLEFYRNDLGYNDSEIADVLDATESEVSQRITGLPSLRVI